MRKLSLWLAGFLVGSLVFSCNNTNTQTAAESVNIDTLVTATEEFPNDTPGMDVSGLYQPLGDSLVLPAFEVEVWLSPEAAADLKKRNETIIVAAYFHAYPSDPEEQAKGMDGEIAVADKLIELSGSDRIARFEGLKFHQDLLNQMEDKDVQLLINVYSGRKSTDDNLLACGIVDAKASQIGDHRYRVACPLITESMDHPGSSTIAFALPEDGAKPTTDLPLVVDCSERGEISFAGTPVATVEELIPLLREALLAWRAQGNKTIPEIKTSGCLMGMQGAVRDVYEMLKTEL